MFRRIFKNIGPGTLVAAAFIGPGTVTLCTLTGAKYGYSLLWAMLLSIIATIILQEMAARLGLVTQQGLPELLKSRIHNKFLRYASIVLVIIAIAIGNAAYEAGNISGGILGLQVVFKDQWYYPLLIGIIAAIILYIGKYKILEKILIALVVIMGISFIATAIAIGPDISAIIEGLFVPQFKEMDVLMVVGLIGTTVVPYNLFLHAAVVKEKWSDTSNINAMRWDTIISIVLGGLVSMAIIIAATVLQGTNVTSADELAKALQPIYGDAATYVFAIGMLAAGITSAITAPLAAAYVVKGCMGWKDGLKSRRFRAVWIVILFIGVLFTSLGIKPIELITLAQVANGLLLPVIAILLMWLVNQNILKQHKNNWYQNILAVLVIAIVLLLAWRTFSKLIASL